MITHILFSLTTSLAAVPLETLPMEHRVQLAPPSPGAPSAPSPAISSRRSKKKGAVRAPRNPSPTVAAPSPTAGAEVGVTAKPKAQKYREQFGWFWNSVSLKFDSGSENRIAKGELVVSNPPINATAVPAPTQTALAGIARDHNTALQAAYKTHGISPAFLLAVIWVESRGNPKAVSPANAGGLMQLIPATADRFGVKNRFDPAQNIQGGAEYFKVLLSLLNNDAMLALAGYNAGENRVFSYDGIPPFAETRDYVPRVIQAWLTAKEICRVKPAKITDFCEFK